MKPSIERIRERFFQLVAVVLTVLSLLTLYRDGADGTVSLVNAIAAAVEFGIALWLLDNAKAVQLVDFIIDRVQRIRGEA